jgi:hypothetical protein
MKRRLLLTISVLMLVLAFGVHPAFAADPPPPCPVQPCVYVDPDRDPAGNEDGKPESPYNTINEGNAYARAQTGSGGAYVISKNADGTWTTKYVDSVSSGAGGLPFPKLTLYLLSAAVALSLILAGWLLQRKFQAGIR